MPIQFCNTVKGGYTVFRKSQRRKQTEQKMSNSAPWKFTATLLFKTKGEQALPFSGEQSIGFFGLVIIYSIVNNAKQPTQREGALQIIRARYSNRNMFLPASAGILCNPCSVFCAALHKIFIKNQGRGGKDQKGSKSIFWFENQLRSHKYTRRYIETLKSSVTNI